MKAQPDRRSINSPARVRDEHRRALAAKSDAQKARFYRAELVKLIDQVQRCLDTLDQIMKDTAAFPLGSERRGRAIGQATSAIDLALQSARRFGLGKVTR